MEEQKTSGSKTSEMLNAQTSSMVTSANRHESPSDTSSSTETPRSELHTVCASAGEDVTLPCLFPNEESTVFREIRWLKGTDCIHLCQVNVGRGYEGRVTVGEDIRMDYDRDVSLILRDVKLKDSGEYKCEILGEDKKIISVIHLQVSEMVSADSRPLLSSLNSTCSSAETPRRQFHTVRTSAGEDVTLPCHLPNEISAVTREIRWFKGTNCIYLGQVTVGRGYEGRVALNGHRWMQNHGGVSLILRDVKVTDAGQYNCEILGNKKEEISVVHLHVSEFKLVSTWQDVKHSGSPPQSCSTSMMSMGRLEAFNGDDVSLQCYLSPETSAVSMEIRWLKGTECIYLYQNGQVTEGRGYVGKVSLFTHELQRGNVSVTLRDVQASDKGYYRCEVSNGERSVGNDVCLNVSELNLVSRPEHTGYLFRFITSFKNFENVSETPNPRHTTVRVCAGDDVILPCLLFPNTNAVSMEIRWLKGTDCIYLYQNGQVTEGRDYEGRVSLLIQELQKGNMSLTLRDVQESDKGDYRCEVTRRKQKLENNGVHLQISVCRLVHNCEDVGKPFLFKDGSWSGPSLLPFHCISASCGNDVTLPCYLSPETSAVSMEIRWFIGNYCIYLYQNGQVTEGRSYVGRVSLFTHELQRGNVSVTLRDIQASDKGNYRCEVTTGDEKLENSIYLSIPAYYNRTSSSKLDSASFGKSSSSKLDSEESSDTSDGEIEKPKRRRSYEEERLNM